MFKEINFKEFYTEENTKIGDGLGGVGIITPNQSIQVINLPDTDSFTGETVDGLGIHQETELTIFNEMFNLGREKIRGYDFKTLKAFEEKVKNGEDNFIIIRYVAKMDYENDEPIYIASISIPMYITEFQYNKLEEIERKLRNLNVETETEITNYNPFTLEKEENVKKVDFYESNNPNNQLKEALKYLKDNNRVEDYMLPFYENYIEVKKDKKKNQI